MCEVAWYGKDSKQSHISIYFLFYFGISEKVDCFHSAHLITCNKKKNGGTSVSVKVMLHPVSVLGISEICLMVTHARI